jgi:hypothetical protein
VEPATHVRLPKRPMGKSSPSFDLPHRRACSSGSYLHFLSAARAAVTHHCTHQCNPKNCQPPRLGHMQLTAHEHPRLLFLRATKFGRPVLPS